MVHVCGEGVQLSRRCLTEWHPARRRQRQRSLDLRLLAHVVGRGKHFFHLCGGIYLIHQAQIEYIWSEKTSFGVSFPQVPTFGATALTDRQLSSCSFWCGHHHFSTAHLVIWAIKNRYWPVWFLLWQFVGEYSPQPARVFLRPGPILQTAYFSSTYPKQVRIKWPPGALLTSPIRCTFHDFPTLV